MQLKISLIKSAQESDVCPCAIVLEGLSSWRGVGGCYRCMRSGGMRMYSCIVLHVEWSSNNHMASNYRVVIRLLVPPSSYMYTLLPMHIDNSGFSVSCAL